MFLALVASFLHFGQALLVYHTDSGENCFLYPVPSGTRITGDINAITPKEISFKIFNDQKVELFKSQGKEKFRFDLNIENGMNLELCSFKSRIVFYRTPCGCLEDLEIGPVDYTLNLAMEVNDKANIIIELLSLAKEREAQLIETSKSTLTYLQFFQVIVVLAFLVIGYFQFKLLKQYLVSKKILK
ncbi:hypothetical protein RF11_02157 [Thelohanellus kitauei]|uniref:GOLD domain-containing protein n=1 Tax=Thelohanellus kitauei TaxID=669202 RepID=A0A0C2MDN9_THEKT|nr:hypothetical protein RF11_02157 [Thelohanellus kitauei]